MDHFGHYLDGEKTSNKKTPYQHMLFFTMLFRLKDAKGRLPARLQKAQEYGEQQGNSDTCLDFLACGP